MSVSCTLSVTVIDKEDTTPAQTPEGYTSKAPHEQLEHEEAGDKTFSFFPSIFFVVFVEKG